MSPQVDGWKGKWTTNRWMINEWVDRMRDISGIM